MKVQISSLTFIFALAASALGARPYIVVLGVAQDAGVPQIGCESPFCQKAWATPSLRRTVSSIALVDPDTRRRWIFDATPDLPEQFQMLKEVSGDKLNTIDGIFLTHAHIGHYTGLMYLGREAMNTREINVFAMPRMRDLLERNAPWSQLISLKNILIRPLADKTDVEIGNNLTVEPFLVPHRDEFSETVGYRIRSKNRTLIFIPDIDKWQKWTTDLAELVTQSDYLLLDGTFFADGELARPMSEVPHPFVSETMELLRHLPLKDRSKVYFTHFNHSNPLIQGDKRKLQDVRRNGFHVAAAALKLYL